MKKSNIHQQIKKDLTDRRRKKTRNLTKLEQEKLVEKQKGYAEDYLDEVAQADEEKAAKAVIETQTAAEQDEANIFAQVTDILHNSKVKFSNTDYSYKLAQVLYMMAETVDWPTGYDWSVGLPSKTKIHLVFRTPFGKFYGKGMKISYYPEDDLRGLQMMTVECENTVDQLEGRLVGQQRNVKTGETSSIKID